MTQEMARDRRAWETGAETVAPGVRRVPLPMPQDGLRAVNIYVVESHDAVVVIDSGWALPESERLLVEELRVLGHGVDDITEFLVTHLHGDHYSQAVAMRKRYGTRVALGAGEAASLRRLRDPTAGQVGRDAPALIRAGAEELVRRLPADVPADPADWPDPDRWLVDGERRDLGDRVLVAVSTPGHTQGHISFHDEGGGLFFAGDHVLPTITPSIGYEAARAEQPLRAYLSSLTLLLSRPDAVLLPAHGPVAPSVHARVRELLEHHRVRLDAMAAAVAAGATTAWETASAATWTRRERRLDELDLFNAMLAVLETDSHLRLLAAEGRLVAEERSGVTTYRPPEPGERS